MKNPYNLKSLGFDNRTPMKYCKTGKPVYDKKAAVSAKNRRYKTDHTELRVYHCNRCNYHHLTSQL